MGNCFTRHASAIGDDGRFKQDGTCPEPPDGSLVITGIAPNKMHGGTSKCNNGGTGEVRQPHSRWMMGCSSRSSKQTKTTKEIEKKDHQEEHDMEQEGRDLVSTLPTQGTHSTEGIEWPLSPASTTPTVASFSPEATNRLSEVPATSPREGNECVNANQNHVNDHEDFFDIGDTLLMDVDFSALEAAFAPMAFPDEMVGPAEPPEPTEEPAEPADLTEPTPITTTTTPITPMDASLEMALESLDKHNQAALSPNSKRHKMKKRNRSLPNFENASEGGVEDQLHMPDLSLSQHSCSGRLSLTSTSSSRSSSRRQNRALQARLEKARNLQRAHSKRRSFNSDAAHSTSWNEDEDPVTGFSKGLRRMKSSSNISVASGSAVSEHTVTTADSSSMHLNSEFDASMSSGTIWAEMEQGEKILAVALSRRMPSLNLPSPSLYLATGTELGTVALTEILDDSSFSASGPFGALGSNARRLVTTLSFRRNGRVRALDFSPDGKFLAVGGDDCMCAIYRLEYDPADNGDKLLRADLTASLDRVDRVYSVQFSHDGRYLAVGGFDGTVAIVSVQEIASTPNPDVVTEISCDGLVLALDWSPDSCYLAFGGSDKCCSIVDVRSSWSVRHQIKRPGSIQSLKWYPDTGHYLAVGSTDVAIVQRKNFTVRKEFDVQRPGFERISLSRTTKVNSLCWSPNGSYFVVGSSNRKCTIIETKTFATVHEIVRSANITSVVWGQQRAVAGLPRRYLAIAGEDCKCVIIQAGLETRDAESTNGDDVSSSACSSVSRSNSQRSCPDWTLKENAFKDLDDGKSSFQPMRSLQSTNIIAIAFSRGSKSRPSTYFACASDDGMVTVRSTINFKVVAELQFPRPVRALAFSHGSRFLAFGCEDSRVYVSETSPSWTVIAQRLLTTPIRSLVFSKDNGRLAVGSIYGGVSILDANKGYALKDMVTDGNDSTVTCVDWSSKNMVVGREDGTVSVYDTQKVIEGILEPVANLKIKTSVQAVALGVSSRFLVIGGADGRASVYSAKGGWVLCHQVICESAITVARWSPTGRYLGFGGNNGYLKVLDTMFWAEAAEVKDVFFCGNGGSRAPVLLAFSQDGKFLALSQSDRCARIVETTKWELTFDLQGTEIADADGTDQGIGVPSSSSLPEINDTETSVEATSFDNSHLASI